MIMIMIAKSGEAIVMTRVPKMTIMTMMAMMMVLLVPLVLSLQSEDRKTEDGLDKLNKKLTFLKQLNLWFLRENCKIEKHEN